MPALDLTITASAGRAYVPILKRQIPRAHRLAHSPLRELSVALVGDRRMSVLHDRYMQMNFPTDVLTFPLDTDARGRAISGEVVICVPEARRASRRVGVSTANEVLLYAVHGLLHLGGWDDRTDREFDRMHQMEDRILKRLGVGPVFFRRQAKGRP